MTDAKQMVEKDSLGEGTAAALAAKGSHEVLSNEALNEGIKSAGAAATGLTADVSRTLETLHSRKDVAGIQNYFENLLQKDGVQKLSTGDFLVREDGKQTLFTPNGDRVTVNPDGTHVIKGDLKSVTSNNDGETNITFKDGAKVTIDNQGIVSVTRGEQTVEFGRNHEPNGCQSIPCRIHTRTRGQSIQCLIRGQTQCRVQTQWIQLIKHLLGTLIQANSDQFISTLCQWKLRLMIRCRV